MNRQKYEEIHANRKVNISSNPEKNSTSEFGVAVLSEGQPQTNYCQSNVNFHEFEHSIMNTQEQISTRSSLDEARELIRSVFKVMDDSDRYSKALTTGIEWIDDSYPKLRTPENYEMKCTKGTERSSQKGTNPLFQWESSLKQTLPASSWTLKQSAGSSTSGGNSTSRDTANVKTCQSTKNSVKTLSKNQGSSKKNPAPLPTKSFGKRPTQHKSIPQPKPMQEIPDHKVISNEKLSLNENTKAGAADLYRSCDLLESTLAAYLGGKRQSVCRQVLRSWKAVSTQMKRMAELRKRRAKEMYELKLALKVIKEWQSATRKILQLKQLLVRKISSRIKRLTISVWRKKVFQTKALLVEWQVRYSWRRYCWVFKEWQSFVMEKKIQARKAQLQQQLKEDKEKEEAAIIFCDHKLVANTFFFWKNATRQTQLQRQLLEEQEMRKQKLERLVSMAQNLKSNSPEKNIPVTISPMKRFHPENVDGRASVFSNKSGTESTHSERRYDEDLVHTTHNSTLQSKEKNDCSHIIPEHIPEQAQAQRTIEKPVFDPMVDKLQKRAEERKNRRELLQKKYEDAEKLRKEQELLKLEEEERLKKEAIKQAKLEKREAMLKHKQQEEEQKFLKAVFEEKKRIALLQHYRSVIIYYGWHPWRELVANAHLKMKKAKRFNSRIIASNTWRTWLDYIAFQKQMKYQIMTRKVEKFRQQKLLQLYSLIWSEWVKHCKLLRKREEVILQRHKLQIKLVSWKIWAQEFLHFYPIRCHRFKQALIHFSSRAQKKFLHKLKKYAQNNKREREILKKREETWSKVRDWLGSKSAIGETYS